MPPPFRQSAGRRRHVRKEKACQKVQALSTASPPPKFGGNVRPENPSTSISFVCRGSLRLIKLFSASRASEVESSTQGWKPWASVSSSRLLYLLVDSMWSSSSSVSRRRIWLSRASLKTSSAALIPAISGCACYRSSADVSPPLRRIASSCPSTILRSALSSASALSLASRSTQRESTRSWRTVWATFTTNGRE